MSEKLSDYDFFLPAELIASYPSPKRADAKLLVLNPSQNRTSHHIFKDILSFFKSGDVLILNDTKVLPARLFGKRKTGGKVEILLLKKISENAWEALIRPGKRVKKGDELFFEEKGLKLKAEVQDSGHENSGQRILEFQEKDSFEIVQQIGHIPLPPYLDRPDTELDREMYQTVFAKNEGAVASPTAGLHFDEALLAELKKMGVQIGFVTLHVGYGTFQPVAVENIVDHKMFEEEFEVTKETAHLVNQARKEGRRVIACGTTSVRTLESAADEQGLLQARRGKTALFIYPPYRFKIICGMITNFHLPKSTLLLLVAALTGKDFLFKAYDEAIREKYRFYSYGDAMLIL